MFLKNYNYLNIKIFLEVYTEVVGAGGCDKPSVLITSPGSPDVHARRRPRRQNNQSANVAGRIQVCSLRNKI